MKMPPPVKGPRKLPIVPQGFANGGKAKPFSGVDSKAEERSEAMAVRSGSVSPKGYQRAEMVEEKREGEKSNPKKLMATGKAIASGKLSPGKYASQSKKG